VHPGPRKHIHLDLRYLVTAPPVAPARAVTSPAKVVA
jgi:hypothetical protein